MQKRRVSAALFGAACLGAVSLSPAVAQTVKIDPGLVNKLPVQSQKLQVVPRIDASRLKKIAACPDPAATQLRITHVSTSLRGGRTMYNFDLHSVISNVGRGEWISQYNQQYAMLSVTVPGARPHVYFRRAFSQLPPGGNIAMDTRLSVYSNEEFPPSAMLTIVYGPDIRSDGNRNNDDCRMSNNTLRLSGTQLMRELRAAAR